MSLTKRQMCRTQEEGVEEWKCNTRRLKQKEVIEEGNFLQGGAVQEEQQARKEKNGNLFTGLFF